MKATVDDVWHDSSEATRNQLVALGWLVTKGKGRNLKVTKDLAQIRKHVVEVVTTGCVVDDEVDLRGDDKKGGVGRRSWTTKELVNACLGEVGLQEDPLVQGEVRSDIWNVLLRTTATGISLTGAINAHLFGQEIADGETPRMFFTARLSVNENGGAYTAEPVYAITGDTALLNLYVNTRDAQKMYREIRRFVDEGSKISQRFPETAATRAGLTRGMFTAVGHLVESTPSLDVSVAPKAIADVSEATSAAFIEEEANRKREAEAEAAAVEAEQQELALV